MSSKNNEMHDTVILQTTLELCNKVRSGLIENFDFYWFLVFSDHSAKADDPASLSAANSFGGRLSPEKVELLTEFATSYLNNIKN